MNNAALYLDVAARLNADTGTGGLLKSDAPLITAVFNNYFNPRQLKPFVVFDCISDVENGCFDLEKIDFTFQLSVYADKTPPALTRASAIIERLYGDAIKNVGFVPTYGLHRYQLTTAASSSLWNYTTVNRVNGRPEHEESYYHFIEVYEVTAYKR